VYETDASNINWNIHPPPCWDGWRPARFDWLYNANYGGVYQVLTWGGNGELQFSAGNRIRLVDAGSAYKYFIVLAVSYYAPWNATNLYLWGGTDYTLSGGAITQLSYSTDKTPHGFPADPRKWMIQTEAATSIYRNNPAANQWFNLADGDAVWFGRISIPYGIWKVSYEYSLYAQTEAAQTNWSCGATLSTQFGDGAGGHGLTDDDFTSCIGGAGASSLNQSIGTVYRSKIIDVALTNPATPYYLNLRTTHAMMDWIGIIPTYHGHCWLRAECVYL
jgi:hypothetical protein